MTVSLGAAGHSESHVALYVQCIVSDNEECFDRSTLQSYEHINKT